MMNENSKERNIQMKAFLYRNRENIILILLIFFTVLSLIYKIYEINTNKLAVLNINDKSKISVTEGNINNGNYVNNGQKNDVLNNPGETKAAPLFILGEKGGKMALYSGDKSEVRQTYDVYIDTLPEYDRNQLAAGIAIYDLKDLDSLIEDFTS